KSGCVDNNTVQLRDPLNRSRCREDATKQIRLVKRSPMYRRVTCDHPPPGNYSAVERNCHGPGNRRVVEGGGVHSAVAGFFLTHYDFLAWKIRPASLPDP